MIKQVISWLGVSLTGSESNSDVTALVDTAGGTTVYTIGLDQLRAYAPARVGTQHLRLINQDKVFSPGNTGSAIYPNVKPGKKTQLSIEGGAGVGFEFMSGDAFEFMSGDLAESLPSELIYLFTGLTEKFSHNSARDEKSVDVSILDMLSRLGDKEISTAFYESIRVDEAIEVVLDAVGWEADKRLLDVANQTLNNWWLNKENAFEAIRQLVLTDGILAFFYCDGAGNFVFKNGGSLLTLSTSILPQITFSDLTNILVENYDDRALEIVLAVQVIQQEREAQALDVAFAYEGDLVLGPSEEITLIISNPEPFKNATEPSLVGTNAEQLLMPTAPLTSGTFIANVNGTDTGPINWNDSLATIQSAFDTAAGAGNTFLTGALATGLRVRFIGDLAAKVIPLITITSSLNPGSAPAVLECQYDGDGTNTVYKLFAPLPLSAGTFKLRVLSNTTSSIDWDDIDTIVETRLVALPLIGPGDATVTGGSVDDDVLTITLDSSFGFQDMRVVDASSLRTSTGATATLIVTETVKGGGADVVISAGDASFSFSVRTSGADVPMVITAGASGATLTNLKVRAQIMKVVRSRVVTYPEGATLPDGQIYKPTIRQEIPLIDAQAFVMTLYDRYSVSRPTETLSVFTDLRSAEANAVFQYAIGHRVRVVAGQNVIDADFYIRQIEHRIDWEYQALISNLGLEAV